MLLRCAAKGLMRAVFIRAHSTLHFGALAIFFAHLISATMRTLSSKHMRRIIALLIVGTQRFPALQSPSCYPHLIRLALTGANIALGPQVSVSVGTV